ncbi:hypothetical protein G8759_14520 [Spirosoma aureum]|uniref:Host attachment protein n=1 Tax=Spirosoma aureum TaxID=2692134 RepID=A0A6G9ANF6_9BACT|nr:hypothetical protein [Spirosoma aureum]QIP13743.1 hypothetical protein G8759_14520 [Spirosoma aureum]
METYTGIWLDHRKALIVSFKGDSATSHSVQVEAQKRQRIHRDGHPYKKAEDQVEELTRHRLANYYETICAQVKDASDIYIFGPGEAKTELEKVLRNKSTLAEKIKQVEPADYLTDYQIMARVREFAAKRLAFMHPLNHPYTR